MSVSGKCFKRRVFNMADANTERRRTLICEKLSKSISTESAMFEAEWRRKAVEKREELKRCLAAPIFSQSNWDVCVLKALLYLF